MDIIEKVTYFTPNEHEAELLFQTNDYEELVKKYPEKLLITMGEKGVLVQLNDGRDIDCSRQERQRLSRQQEQEIH